MNQIQITSENVICGVKFDRFWTFDHGQPSWILRKIKNFSAGLFLVASCMCMPNLVQIRWAGSKLLQKHSFCSPSPSPSCDKAVHRALRWELKKIFNRLVFRIIDHVQANFCPNRNDAFWVILKTNHLCSPSSLRPLLPMTKEVIELSGGS